MLSFSCLCGGTQLANKPYPAIGSKMRIATLLFEILLLALSFAFSNVPVFFSSDVPGWWSTSRLSVFCGNHKTRPSVDKERETQ